MEDSLLNPVGGSVALEVTLTPGQQDLCDRLDELFSPYNLKKLPSDMFKGALFASRMENRRDNPDWLSQAGNSLREILYRFGHDGVPKKEEALRQFGAVRLDEQTINEVGRLITDCTTLAHHGTAKGATIDYETVTDAAFDKLLADFERIMLSALSRQLDVHTELDAVFELATQSD
jgi:hypothetical protein